MGIFMVRISDQIMTIVIKFIDTVDSIKYLTFPICMLGLPFVPWVLAMAFVTNRILDILKPPPARQIQELHGGLGVVLDDLISSCYSLALNHLLYGLLCRLF